MGGESSHNNRCMLPPRALGRANHHLSFSSVAGLWGRDRSPGLPPRVVCPRSNELDVVFGRLSRQDCRIIGLVSSIICNNLTT